MKRFLNTSTALSFALTTAFALPLSAQTVLELRNQEVTCLPNANAECPEGAFCIVARREANCEKNATRTLDALEERGAEGPFVGLFGPAGRLIEPGDASAEAAGEGEGEGAMTDAEAEAAATAAIEGEAVEGEAGVDGSVEVVPEADVAAQEDASAQAEADAAAAEAALAAEAEAQAEADAAAEEAAAQAEAEAAAAADEAAQAEAEAAAQEAAAQAEAEAAAEAAAAQAEADAAAQEASSQAETDAAADADAAQAEADAQAAAEAAAAAAEAEAGVEAEAEVAQEGDVQIVTEAELGAMLETAEGVEAPTAEAVEALSNILTSDSSEGSDETVVIMPEAVAAAMEDEAAAEPRATGDAEAQAATEAEPAAKPRKRRKPRATVTEVTERDTRSSDQDFESEAIAKTTARNDDGDKQLSDLEKFGLVVLGGLVVGAILNNGDEVVSNTGDRVVVQQDDGRYLVLKDDDTLIRRPGSTVETENFDDGSTRSTVTYADGTRIVTIRDASGRVLRRARIGTDGQQVLLIDDLTPVERIDVTTLQQPRDGGRVIDIRNDDAELRAALLARESAEIGRSFSLRQIREYSEVRALAPTIDVESIRFDTGSAAIRRNEVDKLADLGAFVKASIEENPGEVFLIEGHTDAVGSAAYNLALSDRRAESLALALTEFFDVPPENLVVQGYGETELLIDTDGDEARNRRASVRLITSLLSRSGT
jgi:outer membrane protein OmpA-like peptidoglycan-associated protein